MTVSLKSFTQDPYFGYVGPFRALKGSLIKIYFFFMKMFYSVPFFTIENISWSCSNIILEKNCIFKTLFHYRLMGQFHEIF